MSGWQIGLDLVIVVACALVAFRLAARSQSRARQRQALEINDNIVQGLARVKWALEAQRLEDAQAAADETLAEAQKMVTDLLIAGRGLQAGRLRRNVSTGVDLPDS